MDQELFEDLTTSIKEAGAIRRGETAPGRRTVFNELADKELSIKEFSGIVDMYDIGEGQLVERAPGTPEETLESAGCTGGCPTYPGAPMDEMGLPDCSKCPQMNEEN